MRKSFEGIPYAEAEQLTRQYFAVKDYVESIEGQLDLLDPQGRLQMSSQKSVKNSSNKVVSKKKIISKPKMIPKSNRRRTNHLQRIKEVRKAVKGYNSDLLVVIEEKGKNQILNVGLTGRTWGPNMKAAWADFAVIDTKSERILYGEVGACDFDKAFTYYLDKELVWVSIKDPDWVDNIVYFNKGSSIKMPLLDLIELFSKNHKKIRIKIRKRAKALQKK